ncbi:hypothetical protein G9A89_010245 [Geosiphon pyriformis]|nr:hypothetical protein G9A89_010245 [Geosiphon pyriformis]
MINFPTYTFQYVKSLFPIISWLPRYNLTWFTADLIAGLTIGAIVIPQGMAYALIAKLTPEYGLYSSFVGVGLYCLFATSKDVSIGPTSVMALLIGQTIERVRPLTKPEIKEYEIAATLTLFAGLLSGMIGIFRLGVLVELIPGPVIAGFATGSSINIAITQIPQLMGISIKDKEGPAYLIEKETLTELNETNVDAAIGFLCLFYLYLIKFGSNFLSKRYPRHEQIFFFISILRNISIIIFATFASWLIVRGKDTPSIHILGDVPSGFKNIGPPITDINLVKQIAGRIPVIVLILIMEHIAIAKNFGKINHYKSNLSLID